MIWKALAALLTVLAITLAVPVWRHLHEQPPPPPPVIRAQVWLPDDVSAGAGSAPLDAAIAPDERSAVLVATRDGQAQLWVVAFDSGDARPLDGTIGASFPAWHPDGSTLAFFADGKLKVLTLASGAMQDVADASMPAGAAWTPDGALLFAADGGVIRRVRGNALDNVTTLAAGDVSHTFPTVDDAGRLVYVAVRENGARVVRLFDAGTTHDLTETSGHAELRHRLLVHVRDQVLLAQWIDESGTRLIGRSTALATGVGVSDLGHGDFTVSDHIALWSNAVRRGSELAWFDRTGTRVANAAEPGDYWQVRLSPDGRTAAVTTLDPLLRTLDVVAVPLAAPGTARRVSLSIGPDTDPVWSADGRSILYRTAGASNGTVVMRPAGQSTDLEVTVLARSGVDVVPSDVFGDVVLSTCQSPGRRRQVCSLARRTATEAMLTATGFNSWDARVAPDGTRIAYTSDESGRPEIYLQSWPAGRARVRATFGGGQRPRWGRDGTLYFQRGNTVMRTRPTSGPSPTVPTPQLALTADGLRDFTPDPNGDRLLAIVATTAGAHAGPRAIFEWPVIVPPPAPPIVR